MVTTHEIKVDFILWAFNVGWIANIQKAKKFEEDETALLSEYNQQIWKRLNQYAIEYSKEKNIDI